MKESNSVFDAKILLFGEYTVIFNSKALTIPYTFFNGHLSFIGNNKYTNFDKAIISNKELKKYYRFFDQNNSIVENIRIDLRELEKDITNGLYFESNIPQGYGVGSSGALVAAIYNHYCKSKVSDSLNDNISLLKKQFAMMESYFHGTSSGMDPLNCYLGEPLLFRDKDQVELVKVPNQENNSDGAIFLVDTGIPSSTEPMVNFFMEKSRETNYQKLIQNEFIPLNNLCIDQLLKGEIIQFFQSLKSYSGLQHKYFAEMIPEDFIGIWNAGLEQDHYYLKLCGSGGGGFLLGFTRDYNRAEKLLAEEGHKIIPVFKNSKFRKKSNLS
jgi:mevalonate kinase